MKILKKISTILVLAVALCGALTLSAQAVTTLDFGVVVGASGTISYDGLGGSLAGSGIEVATIQGLNTPLHSGDTLNITNGLLSFGTGNFVTYDAGHAQYIFNSGGTGIVITGAISSIGISDDTTQLLFNTSFIGVPAVNYDTYSGAGAFVASFSDEKNEVLASYFGLGTIFNSGVINIGINPTINPPDGFELTASSGDVRNFVPIPPSAWLLGSGLLGLVGLGWRRRTG